MTPMLKRIGLAVGAVTLALGIAAAVHAYDQDTSGQNPNAGAPPFRGRGPGRGMGGPGPGGGLLGPLPMLARELGLSDAQKDQIKSIADSHRSEWKALVDREIAARQALDAAVTAQTVDEATIRQRSSEVAAIEADMAVARARAHAEVFQVLTPDQQAKAKQLQSQMRQRLEAWRSRAPRH